ncbi:MAG: cytochrome c oxidase subunit II [Gemmatimonadota bacterium]|jgi:cytochrome c oxidase subunit 2
MAMRVHHYEKAFLWLGAVMLVVFGITLIITSVAMGIHLPGQVQRLDPSEVRQMEPFDDPGVFQTGENEYQVVLLGFAWAFQPNEIRVPAGAEVTFVATSTDVIHGLHIEKSRVNMMLIPGQVARNTYVFKEPGRYLMVCHEFCGSGHHIMSGEVIVE